ncbi:unnamed protein product, partial [Ectocarpus sp. 12 AP-2014]
HQQHTQEASAHIRLLRCILEKEQLSRAQERRGSNNDAAPRVEGPQRIVGARIWHSFEDGGPRWILVLVTTTNKPSERMGSFSILSLLLLFCLIPSCLILLWSSSQTGGTWWEATVSAIYSQKPDGVFTGGSPPRNNGSPSLPHGH